MTLEDAARDVVNAFTRWSEDASDGTYATYRADDRLTYWKDDDLMAACIKLRQVLDKS